MTLTEDLTQKPLITAYTSDGIQIKDKTHKTHITITPEGKVFTWNIERFEDITLHDCDKMLKHQPEVILIGTGSDHQFPNLDLIRHFDKNNVGIEIMSTPAACRTYNVLILENRKVFAALML